MVFTSNLGVATIIVEETMNLRGIMRVYYVMKMKGNKWRNGVNIVIVF